MLKIPYVSAPENACALACYTMTAKYYFPNVTFEEIAKISGWSEDYVVWPFKFWKWIMDKGIKVVDYDLIDYKNWSKHGIFWLEKSVSKKEFAWLNENSKNLNLIQKEIEIVLNHRKFVHKKEKPSFETLKSAIDQRCVCEVVLDSGTLNNENWFSLHRVVVTEVSNDKITFNDPGVENGHNRTETIKHFVNSWLNSVGDPELCIYSKKF